MNNLYIFDVRYYYLDKHMINSKIRDYVLILIGCVVAIYAQAGEQQNVFVLILGIALLMYGLFKISVTIPSKKNKDEDSDI